jgi:ABC-type maltose transport system permease subunit
MGLLTSTYVNCVELRLLYLLLHLRLQVVAGYSLSRMRTLVSCTSMQVAPLLWQYAAGLPDMQSCVLCQLGECINPSQVCSRKLS